MRCPYCGNEDTLVKNSRSAEEAGAIRRRRICNGCGGRFTTFERVQLRTMIVLKKSGRRVPFDRDKLTQSITLALRKRPIEQDRIEAMVSAIVTRLERLGDTAIPTSQIAECVMTDLGQIDKVGLMRFASVYRDFTSPNDFAAMLREISH